MADILLPIHPRHAESIVSGTKRYEFRRKAPAKPVGRVVVYSTAPVARIVGEFSVASVLTASPDDLWAVTGAWAGITREYFDRYFAGRVDAHAFKVKSATRYATPINPAEIIPSWRGPQSFVYIDSLHARLVTAIERARAEP